MLISCHSKETRRREFNKSKKQRLLVRQTVLKDKDHTTLFGKLVTLNQHLPQHTKSTFGLILQEQEQEVQNFMNFNVS